MQDIDPVAPDGVSLCSDRSVPSDADTMYRQNVEQYYPTDTA
jgi:hypothetical protein